jgi:hypothetical protein
LIKTEITAAPQQVSLDKHESPNDLARVLAKPHVYVFDFDTEAAGSRGVDEQVRDISYYLVSQMSATHYECVRFFRH